MGSSELGKTYHVENTCEESSVLFAMKYDDSECLNSAIPASDAVKLYQYFADTVSQGVSLSCSATQREVDAWEQTYSTTEAKLKQIKAYCKAMLADVCTVNEKKSVVVFSTLPMFMGFLSNLCFYKNNDAAVHKDGTLSEKVFDNVEFRVYVRRFILDEPKATTYGMLNSGRMDSQYKGFDWLLYKFIRCGLVHSQSLVDEKEDQDRLVSVEITHDKSVSVKSPKEIDAELGNRNPAETYQCVISAAKLIEWIEKSIEKMFEAANEDENLGESIIEVFKASTPVMKVGTISQVIHNGSAEGIS